MDPLQLFADAHVAHLEVDVEPSEAECLALPEPVGFNNYVEFTGDGVQGGLSER